MIMFLGNHKYPTLTSGSYIYIVQAYNFMSLSSSVDSRPVLLVFVVVFLFNDCCCCCTSIQCSAAPPPTSTMYLSQLATVAVGTELVNIFKAFVNS